MSSLVVQAAIVTLVYLILRACYLLNFHPLAHYPGPRLAAVTDYYCGYYDVWHKGGGELVRQLHSLHSIYGPVVRMAPNSLHFSDPQAYIDIYRMGGEFRKNPELYDPMDLDKATVGFIDPKAHKLRRETLNPMFQPKAIAHLEYVLQEKVDTFLSHLKLKAGTGQPVNLQHAFRAVTVDIITAYSFGESMGCLDVAEFTHPFVVEMTGQVALALKVRWIPLAYAMMRNMPSRIAYHLLPVLRPALRVREALGKRIEQFREHPDLLNQVEHEIIFNHLMQPGETRLSDKSILQEAVVVILAGSDTVAFTCYSGFFNALADRVVLNKLHEELDAAWPDKEQHLSYQVLEKLPYLTAYIKECLRMHTAVPVPLERVATKPMTIANVHVPVNSVVSISSTFVHENADIFEDPHVFNPDRWLKEPQNAQGAVDLETWLVPFSRGSRNCLGLHLAWAELYLILGTLLRKLDVEIHETSMSDIAEVKHHFTALNTGKPFHVMVKGLRD